ncbi:GlxA family transcriptional regulator [Streptomyces specialis]|uniref:GlxA family transcriptional regulator n=1 Tax=Streptomyces specialis TaxID=498367 RepID=UPI00073E2B1D|nr:helix-turn-helix domain-containing protein [Streptomyces specialis]
MHRVVALVRPPQSTFELSCAAEVFGTERRGLPKRYEFGVCTEHPGPVATRAGYDMVVADGLDALDRADTVVVPGWLPAEVAPSPAVVRALRRAHDRGARVVSICSGVFALAHAGLLDGRRATTHWARAAELAARFPAVRVDPDVLYVDHGDVATSAGCGAGIDLCLHLVRADQGAGYAAHVARSMVMPPHREGGQLQYSAPPRPAQIDGSLAPLLEWVTGRLLEPLTVEDLAAHAGVSVRTLARRFAEQLGVSPGQWLLSRRIDAARALLESSDLPLDAIARRVGLSSATNLRRRFHRALGTTPGAYRRTFRADPRRPPSGVPAS